MNDNTLMPINQFHLDEQIEQIILVTAMPRACTGHLSTFQKNKTNNQFESVLDMIPVVLGRYGMTANKHEGDEKSPLGLHKIGHAFGKNEKPGYINLPYIETTKDDKFIDDTDSPDYNSWVRGDTVAKSYEIMQRQDETYDLGVVIEYNMHPVTPDRGSAIFMHIWRNSSRGTDGCIAMDKDNLKRVLKWLKPQFNPHIYILEN